MSFSWDSKTVVLHSVPKPQTKTNVEDTGPSQILDRNLIFQSPEWNLHASMPPTAVHWTPQNAVPGVTEDLKENHGVMSIG